MSRLKLERGDDGRMPWNLPPVPAPTWSAMAKPMELKSTHCDGSKV